MVIVTKPRVALKASDTHKTLRQTYIHTLLWDTCMAARVDPCGCLHGDTGARVGTALTP